MANMNTAPVYTSQVTLALVKASEWHQSQLRKDGLPYLSHLLRVMGYVWQFNSHEEVAIAGLLHDAVEDASISLNTIEELFGSQVAQMVAAVSEDKELPKTDRKRAYITSISSIDCPIGAVIVSMMDKYDNLMGYVTQPHLVSPDVIEFMQELIYVFRAKVHEGLLVSEGAKSYTQLLDEMQDLVNRM